MDPRVSLIPAPRSLRLAGSIAGGVPVERQTDGDMQPESFRLQINAQAVMIRSADDAGFFYAERALEQLKAQTGDALPCLELSDAPRYSWRGFHIDTARHFVPLKELERMVEAAASFRLNRFHWHFSDDQGWRIESLLFPRLQQIGAKRQGDHMGAWNSDKEEHFFYTQTEVRRLVEFCRVRNIEIVPELDIPGHVTALLAAYPQFSCTGEPVETATRIGIFPELLCPGKEEMFPFLFALMDELCELFPGPWFHIGGDEVPKTRWNECPHCKARMQQMGLQDTRQLQGWMMNRVAAHLRQKGKRAIVWNEAALGGNLDTDIIVQVWNDDPKDPSLRALSKERDEHGKPTSPNQGISAKLLRKDHDLILSNMLGSYCDYPHAYISTKMVYEWPLLPQKCESLRDQAAKHILGTECLIWTEHIRDDAALESLAWPRFAAKAGRAWCGDNAPGYGDFVYRMKRLFPYLRSKVPHATPPSGWKPGPLRSAKEMLAFMKNISRNDRKGYQQAQAKV